MDDRELVIRSSTTWANIGTLARPAGVEPATTRLEVRKPAAAPLLVSPRVPVEFSVLVQSPPS